jgi:hypothetical protein
MVRIGSWEGFVLVGVDVGFSKTRRTTGIALLEGEKLTLHKVGTSWEARKAVLPVDLEAAVTALDGPLVKAGSKNKRSCEVQFSRGPFAKRCKPGLSHFGTGLKLREATTETAKQFAPYTTWMIEAFPNLFLGVLTPDSVFAQQPKLKRGQKFDWLYEECAVSGIVEQKLKSLVKLPSVVWEQLRVERDHELRAALICLLTAALDDTGNVETFGDTEGGWFWLPPQKLWQPWARVL